MRFRKIRIIDIYLKYLCLNYVYLIKIFFLYYRFNDKYY